MPETGPDPDNGKEEGETRVEENNTVPAAEQEQEQPAADAQDAALKKRHQKRMRALRSFLLRFALLAAVIYVLFFQVVGIATMPNRDMYPRLDAGDMLLYYRLERNPKPQDIIVIGKAADSGEAKKCFVCRVVAVPGDTVEVSKGKGLCVNGNSLIENGIFYPTEEYENRMDYPVTLGEGEYFVMADRRNGGMDSRYFGTVKQDEIQGVVITLLRRNNL